MGIQAWQLKGRKSARQRGVTEKICGSNLDESSAIVQEVGVHNVDDAGLDSKEPANRWKVLQDDVAGCTACVLHKTRTQTVFGVGNHNASWMVIGEAPGANEDLQGEPFVGRAGLLLNEMLRAIGLRREEVFIANMLKCRPPGNRDPKPDEVDACEAYLIQQVDLLKPNIILAVGRVAAQNLLKTKAPIGRLRGKQHLYRNIPVVVIYHPAYLLRSLLEKRKAWDDLQFARRVFDDNRQSH